MFLLKSTKGYLVSFVCIFVLSLLTFNPLNVGKATEQALCEFWLPWEPSTPHWGSGSEGLMIVASEDSEILYNGLYSTIATGTR